MSDRDTTNLLEETLEILEEHNKTWNDVKWVGTQEFKIPKANFETLAKKTNYDAGYGWQEVARDLIVAGDNWCLKRKEYDGSESWEFAVMPDEPSECRHVDHLSIHEGHSGWESLSELNDMMTDEEMARAYIIKIYDLRKDLEIWRIKKDNEWRMVFNAFLAGLKAGKDMAEADIATVAYKQGAERYKTKWHKVADGDLPKETEFIESDVLLLLVQLKGTEHKRYELGRYIFSENVFTYTHLKSVEDVVAWCEIPKYTEE